jgi:RimJ/RimL family protein N-acetyltransferase
MELVDAWPLFALRLRHEDMEMRTFTDLDGLVVASWMPTLLAPEERHFMPILSAHMKGDDPLDLARKELGWIWQRRASTSPESWAMSFLIEIDGEPVGAQSCEAEQFPVLRTVGSGSFLVPDRRGEGIGSRARAAMLELVFGHLGGLAAESGHMAGNDASRRVSDRLGYVPNGVAFHEFEGRRHEEQKLLLTSERWLAHRPAWLDDLVVEGVDPVKRQLGLADDPGDGPT